MKGTKTIWLHLSCCLLQLIITVSGKSEDVWEIWQQISTNYSDDIQQANEIYGEIKSEQRALAATRSIVERHLRTKNAERLVSVISSTNISQPDDSLAELSTEFKNNYDGQVVDSIFAAAIRELIANGKLSTLPATLWNIHQGNDAKLFEVMLRAQLQLYNGFGRKHHTDEKEFLRRFSNTLYKIKKEFLYSAIDLDLKLKVQAIVEQLPDYLKYLYFMPYFCLLNIKYATYIYTAVEAKVDLLSRYTWLWHDSRSMDDTGFIKAEINDLGAGDDKRLIVVLKGTKYQLYYYMMPSSKKIAGWESQDAPVNYIWNIEFLDNERVVFSQNDFLMCAVERHDNDRRNVAGRKKGEVSSMSPECQWGLGQCNFR